jgi:predicted ATPase
MIGEISIKNFKSVKDLSFTLGRVTVLIGENGSGKSNILEAVALLGAGAANKLDNEFLVSRGIRITESPLMLSAFSDTDKAQEGPNDRVKLTVASTKNELISLTLTPQPDRWSNVPTFSIKISKDIQIGQEGENDKKLPVIDTPEKLFESSKPVVNITDKGLSITIGPVDVANDISDEVVNTIRDRIQKKFSDMFVQWDQKLDEKELHCSRFLIYAPENSALRRFEEEGQIQPVGIRGEGLFKMLQTFADVDNGDRLAELKKSLELVGWFFDFSISPNLAPGDNRLRIHDRFLSPNLPFDQRSANEGFLFLIFYFAIFLSKTTPQFFAIDNIDAALNPKLCAELMRRLCELAKKYDKQVILTTHNPAILDGLNLSDDEQRLYSVYRNDYGYTKVRRIQAPKPRTGVTPTKLSDAFMHGLIGGLPKNF